MEHEGSLPYSQEHDLQPILSQVNSVHVFLVVSLGFQNKNFYEFLVSSTRVTRPAHLTLPKMITQTKYGKSIVTKVLIMQSSLVPRHFLPMRSK